MNFGDYLTEANRYSATFTFGRFQPPTIGHEKLFKAVKMHAGSDSVYIFFLSQSHDSKTNPLKPAEKLKLLKKMFPEFARNIKLNYNVRNLLEAAAWLHDKGYTSIKMVAGSDRVKNFETLLNRYNGKKQANGNFFDFEKIEVVSAGARDPEADGATGMSATKARALAREGNFEGFKKAIPSGTLSDKEIRDLMKTIRGG